MQKSRFTNTHCFINCKKALDKIDSNVLFEIFQIDTVPNQRETRDIYEKNLIINLNIN